MTRAIKTNTLYKIANKYRTKITDESEIELIDMTEILEREEEEMIKRGEIIIENVNAKMRLGKSTMAIARAIRIHKLLKKYGKVSNKEKFGMRHICRDDQEFSKRMRNPDVNNTILVTDESNELEKTGENSSVESALKEVFSSVQAARYVHRICCSPKEVIDPNADIILNVIAVDKIAKITRSKLYYRYFEGEREYTQLLGFVDTYVGDVIKGWTKVEEKFLKTKKTKEEIKIPNIRVRNMTGSGYNEVPNQFIINTDEGEYFQSYRTMIGFRNNNGEIFLNETHWDYSRTTGKYRNKWLGMDINETRQAIKNGEIKLVKM